MCSFSFPFCRRGWTSITGETDDFCLSFSRKPITCPMRPPGFGTGHSLLLWILGSDLLFDLLSAISVSESLPPTSPPSHSSRCWICGLMLVCCSLWYRFCNIPCRWLEPSSLPSSRCLRYRIVLVFPGLSPSAKAVCGTGHGRICGSPTTRNETARVVVKREKVCRDRGWSAGGMLLHSVNQGSRGEDFFRILSRL